MAQEDSQRVERVFNLFRLVGNRNRVDSQSLQEQSINTLGLSCWIPQERMWRTKNRRVAVRECPGLPNLTWSRDRSSLYPTVCCTWSKSLIYPHPFLRVSIAGPGWSRCLTASRRQSVLRFCGSREDARQVAQAGSC